MPWSVPVVWKTVRRMCKQRIYQRLPWDGEWERKAPGTFQFCKLGWNLLLKVHEFRCVITPGGQTLQIPGIRALGSSGVMQPDAAWHGPLGQLPRTLRQAACPSLPENVSPVCLCVVHMTQEQHSHCQTISQEPFFKKEK